MKRRRLLITVACAIAVCLAVSAAGILYVSDRVFNPPVNRQSAISTTIIWARLAPLPPSAQNVQVQVKGSMFTREFIISFDATPVAIEQWLAASPGPSSATQTVIGLITTYAIKPGGGAEFAELKVDRNVNRVVIRSYWS